MSYSTGDELPVALLRPPTESSGVPKYRQIVEQFVALLDGVEPGVRLPSEPELSRHLGVSRNTAIQALHELQRRGLAVRRQGRGTFTVGRHRAVRSLMPGRLPSFSEDLRHGGHQTREEMLRFGRIPLPDHATAALRLPAGSTGWCVERVIHCDGSPVVHVQSWLPTELYPSLDADRVANGSLYEHLEQVEGGSGRPYSADEEWTAGAADQRTARLLSIPARTPVMLCRRTAFLTDGRPAEHSLSSVSSGHFAIAVHISPESYVNGAVPTLQAGGA